MWRPNHNKCFICFTNVVGNSEFLAYLFPTLMQKQNIGKGGCVFSSVGLFVCLSICLSVKPAAQ